MGKFEVYKDIRDEWRFRLRANNHKIICVSEGYKRRSSAIKGVDSIVNNCREPIQTIFLD